MKHTNNTKNSGGASSKNEGKVVGKGVSKK